MPIVSNEGNGGYWEPEAVGPVAMNYPPVTPPASIAANASFSTPVFRSDGFKCITVGAKLSAAATLSVQRFIDLAGTIPQGAPSSTPLAAGTFGAVNVVDGLPFGSFQVTITAGAAVVNVTNFVVLQTAA